MAAVTSSLPALTEKQWQATVVELAEHLGWTWVHFPTVLHTRRDRASETGFVHRYKTPSQGPLGHGWPDLVLVRDRVLFVELKKRGGGLSEDQVRVRDILRTAEAEWHLWFPADFDEARRVLSMRGAA